MHSPPKPRTSAIDSSSLAWASSKSSTRHLNRSAKSPPRRTLARAQEAPKEVHRPAARDVAAEGQRRDTHELETPPVAGTTIRSPAETQSGTGQRVLREPIELQRSSARGKQKPKSRPHSSLVAPPEIRPPDARQPGSPKKGFSARRRPSAKPSRRDQIWHA